jgi:hypothetical protein
VSETFAESLERAAKIVASWPEWKQQTLGGAMTKVLNAALEESPAAPSMLEVEHQELAFALMDLLDGTWTDYDLQGDLGSPIERCREILALRDRMMAIYRQAWLHRT